MSPSRRAAGLATRRVTRFAACVAAVLVCAVVAVRPATARPALPGEAQQPVDVTGRWAFAVMTENGTGYPTVTLKQSGEKLTGTYESARMGVRPLEGTIKADTVRFTFTGAAEGMPAFSFVAVLVDRDNLRGTLEMGGMGSATFTGRRER